MKSIYLTSASALLCLSLSLAAPLRSNPTEKRSLSSKWDLFTEGFDCMVSVGPLDCGDVWEDSETAKNAALALIANKTFPANSDEDGQADAFRHCYWSALMTISIGESQAKEVSDAHEEHGKNLPQASNMDLFNNAKGREIGKLTLAKESNKDNAKVMVRAECIAATLNELLMNAPRS